MKEQHDQKRKRESELDGKDGNADEGKTKCTKNGFNVGDVVMARYCTLHDQEYKANVISADSVGDEYKVEWEDGDKTNKKKKASDMRVWKDEKVQESGFKIGDHVLAKYSQNGVLYDAVIVALRNEGKTFKIRWSDGDKKDRLKNKYQLFHPMYGIEKETAKPHPSVGGLTLR